MVVLNFDLTWVAKLLKYRRRTTRGYIKCRGKKTLMFFDPLDEHVCCADDWISIKVRERFKRGENITLVMRLTIDVLMRDPTDTQAQFRRHGHETVFHSHNVLDSLP